MHISVPFSWESLGSPWARLHIAKIPFGIMLSMFLGFVTAKTCFVSKRELAFVFWTCIWFGMLFPVFSRDVRICVESLVSDYLLHIGLPMEGFVQAPKPSTDQRGRAQVILCNIYPSCTDYRSSFDWRIRTLVVLPHYRAGLLKAIVHPIHGYCLLHQQRNGYLKRHGTYQGHNTQAGRIDR